MDEETRRRIREIEDEVRCIDRGIAWLQRRREEVLMSDEEYVGYVEQYQAYYDDDPLPIGRYYEKVEELEAISRLFNKPEADIEALWDKHGKRIAELERVLAA